MAGGPNAAERLRAVPARDRESTPGREVIRVTGTTPTPRRFPRELRQSTVKLIVDGPPMTPSLSSAWAIKVYVPGARLTVKVAVKLQTPGLV